MKSSFASFIFILILVTVFQGLSSGNSRETKLSDSSWRLSKKSHELAKPCHISVALSFQTIHESGILNDLTVNGLSFLMRESSFQWNFRGVRVRNGRLPDLSGGQLAVSETGLSGYGQNGVFFCSFLGQVPRVGVSSCPLFLTFCSLRN